MTPKKPLVARIVGNLDAKQIATVLVAVASLGGCFHNQAEIGAAASLSEDQSHEISATQLMVVSLGARLSAVEARLRRVEKLCARAGTTRTVSNRGAVGPPESAPRSLLGKFFGFFSNNHTAAKGKWSPPTGPGVH